MPGVPTELTRLSARYRAFADDEARGSSAIYEALAHAVADCEEVLAFIATLPSERRQPNLFLAAVRHLYGVPRSAGHLTDIVRQHHEQVRGLMLTRTTQTNEPARCALMLPILGTYGRQPLALLEVGASAGLCLLPDHYGYAYGATRLMPKARAGIQPPVLACETNGPVPVPDALPSVVWRRGLDLNPVDVHTRQDVAWLETLVWPGQEERSDRLRAAIEIARQEQPKVVKGDLLQDLSPVMAMAPTHATLVVFHTAVLAYVASQPVRDRFARAMRDSGVDWVSIEAPGVFPEIARKVPRPPSRRGLFLVARNGQPVAWAGPHGQSIDWFDA